MFNLMKKDKEKDGARKEKKEKKEKKERMSAAELKSLEEMSMRRGFFNLNRASKRDSKTRLEISNPIPIKVASGSDLHLTDIDSDSNRGSVILDSGHLSTASSSDDLKVDDANFKGSVLQRAAKFGSLAKQNSQMIVKRFSFSQKSRDESTSETSTPSEHSAAPSPQVEVRTLETQLAKQGVPLGHPCTPPAASLRARVPELVGKRFPAELRLPALVPPQPPTPRQLELQRRNTGDFGFSLRRTTMLDRAPDGQVYRRVVHFAEPGAGTKDLALGLVPGDRLVEINGRNVENKSRDEIVEMIRQSGETVQLKVQPILELSELSRCWLRGGQGTRRAAWDVSNAVPTAGPVPWVSAGHQRPCGGCLGWQGPWEPAGAGAALVGSDARGGAGGCGWDAGVMPARALRRQSGCKGGFASGLVNRRRWVLPPKMLSVLLGLVFLLPEGLWESPALHHLGEICPHPFAVGAWSGRERSFAPHCWEIPNTALQKGHCLPRCLPHCPHWPPPAGIPPWGLGRAVRCAGGQELPAACAALRVWLVLYK